MNHGQHTQIPIPKLPDPPTFTRLLGSSPFSILKKFKCYRLCVSLSALLHRHSQKVVNEYVTGPICHCSRGTVVLNEAQLQWHHHTWSLLMLHPAQGLEEESAGPDHYTHDPLDCGCKALLAQMQEKINNKCTFSLFAKWVKLLLLFCIYSFAKSRILL